MKRLLSASSLLALAATAALPALVLPATPAFAETAVTAQEARQIASEAYLYFYPLISMDVTRRVSANVPPARKKGSGRSIPS